MSTVDISKNYRQYSPEQLRNWAYNGLLEREANLSRNEFCELKALPKQKSVEGK